MVKFQTFLFFYVKKNFEYISDSSLSRPRKNSSCISSPKKLMFDPSLEKKIVSRAWVRYCGYNRLGSRSISG